MTVKPRDLLDQAIALKSGSGEANARLAISRAYYAALHRSIEVLPDLPPKTEDERNTHHRVIAAMERMSKTAQPGRSAAFQIARILRQLRRSRVSADYELDSNVGPDELTTAISQSEHIFKLCDEVERLRKAAGATPKPPAK
jgi:uncharacterized protein (UPF0332 family)